MPQRRSYRAPGRIDARNQQQAERAEDLAVRKPFPARMPRLDQEADEIITRLLVPLRNLLAEVIRYLLFGLLQRGLVGHAFLQGHADP